jgi:hypothetical protein
MFLRHLSLDNHFEMTHNLINHANFKDKILIAYMYILCMR